MMTTTVDAEPALPAGSPQPLRLAAVDHEDLAVVSAHLHEAEAVVADMAYLPRERRFALLLSRFDWPLAATGRFERCRTGLHFEHVRHVSRRGFGASEPDMPRSLLAITFTTQDAPSGTVLFTFTDSACIRLSVECLEAEMRDLGPRWAVPARPDDLIPDEAGAADGAARP